MNTVLLTMALAGILISATSEGLSEYYVNHFINAHRLKSYILFRFNAIGISCFFCFCCCLFKCISMQRGRLKLVQYRKVHVIAFSV